MRKIAYIGVDYHINSLSIAVMLEGEKDFLENVSLRNEYKVIRKYLQKLDKEYDLRVCYEASCSGYVFQRKVNSWGFHCDVIAPSLVPNKPGDRRKNDFRDAKKLARNYCNGDLTIVSPPNEEQESVRSLSRCRLALKDGVKRTKNQINSFLLAHDERWMRSNWTHAHRSWLSKIKFSNPHLQTVMDENMGLLEYLESRVKHVEQQIQDLACSEVYAPSVRKLCALRGIGPLSAMLLITEITDFRRFASPKALMAFLGLIPSEDSSGDKTKGKSITKAGNPRCRTQLVESVQHYSRRAVIGPSMKKNLAQVDAHSANIAVKCMNRLHKRYWALIMKGKIRQVAMTAVARELVGFIWAMMNTDPVASPA